MPAFTGFTVKNLDLFPVLFVTIASEHDMRPVGYGSMLVESTLGVVALIVVCAAASNGKLLSGTPFQLFSGSVAGLLTNIFGVPSDIAACILTMCVSALALTSVDAVARIGRMSFQERFTPVDDQKKTPVQAFFSNTVVATVLTLICSYMLCLAGFMSIRPLFGSANQLLAALVLTAQAVFLQSRTARAGCCTVR